MYFVSVPHFNTWILLSGSGSDESPQTACSEKVSAAIWIGKGLDLDVGTSFTHLAIRAYSLRISDIFVGHKKNSNRNFRANI